MCGFLLKVLVFSIMMYKVLGTVSMIHVVTFGGQLLGAVIIGFFAVVVPMFSKRVLSTIEYAHLTDALLLMLITYLTITFLPGYKLINTHQFIGGVIFFCAVSLTMNNYIENK